MKITRDIEFDMAHRLPDHEGKCFRLHGHRYVVTVTIEGPVQDVGPENGMVLDYSRVDALLKQFVGRHDHRTMLYFNDPLFLFLTDGDALSASNISGAVLIGVDEWGIDGMIFVPTAENMAQHFANLLADQDIGVIEVLVREGPKSAAVAVPQPACESCRQRGRHQAQCETQR